MTPVCSNRIGSRAPRFFDQRRDALHGRLRRLTVDRVTLAADSRQQATHLHESPASGLGDLPDRPAGLLWSSGGGGLRAVGDRDHHGETVGDHVVHLPRDPLAFERGSDVRLLVSLTAHLLRSFHECADLAPPVADVEPDEDGHQRDRDHDGGDSEPVERPGVEVHSRRQSEQRRAEAHAQRQHQRSEHARRHGRRERRPCLSRPEVDSAPVQRRDREHPFGA